MIESSWINSDTLAEIERNDLEAEYRGAEPFPHLVIDHLFSTPLLRAVLEEFDNGSLADWRDFHGTLQNKRGTASNSVLPNTVQEYFNFLYSGPFIKFLSRITGIDDLIPDPSLYGGGMHQVNGGGRFEVHMDFKKHPRTGLSNRLVVITYLNDNWASKDGGALELWDTNPPRCLASVIPTFARTVIMAQSGRSAHGHPKPVGEGRQRRSVIAYFYTSELGTESESDSPAMTIYIPHKGYSRRQQLELYLRKITPISVHRHLRAILEAFRARRSRPS